MSPLTMMRTKEIRNPVWKPDAEIENSFTKEGYRHCQILGRARLVRLLSHAGQAPEGQMYEENRVHRPFWFAEEDFLKIKSRAEADLRSQGKSNDGEEKFKFRVGMYMRHEFRHLLAVRRDWTPSFDYYVVMTIPENESIIALEGFVGAQPVYSPGIPGARMARKRRIKLGGELKESNRLKQYVIPFHLAANGKATGWIDESLRAF